MPGLKGSPRPPPIVSGSSDGPATDVNNIPVIDPTANVLSLVASAIQRQDDLRAVTTEHLKEMSELRAAHAEQLRQAETARIDAIRAVDVGAVNRAAEVASTQATTLATQVTTVAEALRTQVAAAATASTIALAAALEPIQRDVADLRRVQFEQQGAKVAKSDEREIHTSGRGDSAFILSLVMAAVTIISIVFGIVMALR